MRTKSPNTVTELAVPLKPAQIEAAQKLYERLPGWRASNEARDLDADSVLGWHCPHCQRFYGAQEVVDAEACARACSAQVNAEATAGELTPHQ